jgi:ankyrin repeat protein
MADSITANQRNPLCDALRDRETTLDDIRSIVSGNPDLLGQRDQWGSLPLHVALRQGASPDTVRYLVEQRPESVREPTHDRVAMYKYPIHLAFFTRFDGLNGEAMKENVRALVEAWPESLEARDGQGNTALHIAGWCRTPFEMVQYLVEKSPSSVQARNNMGCLPLHKALSLGDDVVRFLVEQYPESVRTMSNDGIFALREAIRCQSPPSTLQFLLQCWPESVREPLVDRDDSGRTLMHEAADYHNLPAATWIAAEWPESVRVRSQRGRLPIHEAASHGHDGSLCQFLVGQWPESVRERCHDGRIPLHEAARTGRIDVARYLVEQWPESVSVATNRGCLPLHLVARYMPISMDKVRKALATAQFLLEQHPRAAWEATDDGYLPLHIASCRVLGLRIARPESEESRMGIGLVRLFLEEDRRLVRVPSREGQLPLHYAIRGGSILESAQILGQEWSESLLFWNAEGRSTLHEALARELSSLELVRWLVELHPELLDRTDPNGRLPLHTAAVSNQPRGVVALVAERLPQAAARKDRSGSLPLHLARSLEVVEVLVNILPESVDVRDQWGALPLHNAVARRDASLDAVRFLVEDRPPSVEPVDGAGMRPLHVAAKCDAPLDVLFFLASKDPESIYGRPSPDHSETQRSRKRPSTSIFWG